MKLVDLEWQLFKICYKKGIARWIRCCSYKVQTKGKDLSDRHHNFLLYIFRALTKLAARSRDKEDANVMLIIILLVFFFVSRELFCKRDRKFELTAGEQGICIMQLSEFNQYGLPPLQIFLFRCIPKLFLSPDVSQQLHSSVVYLTTKSVNYHYNYCHKYI